MCRLVDGVRTGAFALVAGSDWQADDAIVRFNTAVDPGEVLFQPGLFLVRAAAAKELLSRREPEPVPTPLPVPTPQPQGGGATEVTTRGPETERSDPTRRRDKVITSVTINLKSVPASKVRDVVKVAVLGLASVSANLTVDMTITADGGLSGIPRETVDLVVTEGLSQLGLGDADIRIDES